MKYNNLPPIAMINTICWKNNAIEILDQTVLPEQEKYVRLETLDQLIDAIKKLKVRGAPALGVAGAYGMVLGILELGKRRPEKDELQSIANCLIQSRPTAVNLRKGVDRVMRRLEKFNGNMDLFAMALDEANLFLEEDRAMCRQIGINGEHLLPDGCSVLTHCNTGGLATSGYGTALGVIITATERKKKIHVYVDETRPLLQGARLTAWELQKEGVAHTLICDNMAGWLMRQKKIDAVIVGADRIAANGDTANKIGTYSIALLAMHHNIPFYVAAPSTTIDPAMPDGNSIPIEMRAEEEITTFHGHRTAPADTKAYNPAFDVTPANMIRAILTEQQVFYGPHYAFYS